MNTLPAIIHHFPFQNYGKPSLLDQMRDYSYTYLKVMHGLTAALMDGKYIVGIDPYKDLGKQSNPSPDGDNPIKEML